MINQLITTVDNIGDIRKYRDIFVKTISRRENIAIFSVLIISRYFQNIGKYRKISAKYRDILKISAKYRDILKISAIFKNLKKLFFMLADILPIFLPILPIRYFLDPCRYFADTDIFNTGLYHSHRGNIYNTEMSIPQPWSQAYHSVGRITVCHNPGLNP